MNRRDFLKVTALTAVTASADCRRGDSKPQGAAPTGDRLLSLTAVDAIAAIRQGDITAESYAAALLFRADRLRELNAYITLNREGLMEGARAIDVERRHGGRLGPLAGLPLLVKDNIDSAALPTTAGSKGLGENRPKQDAPVLKTLLSRAALLMAKMNMHELAIGITSSNAAYGPVRNPYDQKLIAEGSSGGTAAGIAARMAPAGLGTDTGGSVRIPAALCGIVGLRPSVGNGTKRYSAAGVVPISDTRDTVGPMGRTVGDVALLDSIVANLSVPKPVALTGLRLGVPLTSPRI
jgi:Asp-tRNA(Asn)/Glu-tRNA(Gln) amidotransferase A subunit family amidase